MQTIYATESGKIKRISSKMDKSSKQGLITLISGGISGAISRTITAPMDRLRIQLQADYRR